MKKHYSAYDNVKKVVRDVKAAKAAKAKKEAYSHNDSAIHFMKNNLKNSVVEKAAHYNTGKYEVIDVAEDWGLDKDAYLFNSFKYIARAGKKDASKTIEDLEKAAYYLKRKITNMKKKS